MWLPWATFWATAVRKDDGIVRSWLSAYEAELYDEKRLRSLGPHHSASLFPYCRNLPKVSSEWDGGQASPMKLFRSVPAESVQPRDPTWQPRNVSKRWLRYLKIRYVDYTTVTSVQTYSGMISVSKGPLGLLGSHLVSSVLLW